MSRTVHHIRQEFWNHRDHRSAPVAHVLFDLRFAAGCRRVPQRLRHEVTGGGYLHGHMDSADVGERAREFQSIMRAEMRVFSIDAIKFYRAGSDLEELREPNGRTRHSAIWDML